MNLSAVLVVAQCAGGICGGWAHWVFGVCAGGLGVIVAGVVRCSVAVGGVCGCVCVCVCVYMCIGGLSISIFQRFFASIGKMIVFELLSCLGTRQATYVYHVYY